MSCAERGRGLLRQGLESTASTYTGLDMQLLRSTLPLFVITAIGMWLASKIFDLRTTFSSPSMPIETELPISKPSKPEVNLNKVSQLFPRPAKPIQKDPTSILKDVRILGRIVTRDEKASKLIIETGGQMKTFKAGEHLNSSLKLNHITPNYFTLLDGPKEYIIEFKSNLHILSENRLSL